MPAPGKIICPICRRATPENLNTCIHCQADLPKKNWNISRKNMIIIAIVLLVFVIFMLNRSCGSDDNEIREREQSRETLNGL